MISWRKGSIGAKCSMQIKFLAFEGTESHDGGGGRRKGTLIHLTIDKFSIEEPH